MSSKGSIIVIANSNKFSKYLEGSMVNNIYFRNLNDFIETYRNLPLTASKVIVFESAILETESIKKFSDLILDEISQVEEILFLVSLDYKQYFNVSLNNFQNKKFLSVDLTYKKLEDYILESKSYSLKQEPEFQNVVQRKRSVKPTDIKVGKYQTRVVIDRRFDNPNKERESELMNRDIDIRSEKRNIEKTRNDFIYNPPKSISQNIGNTLLFYDSGFNLYDLVKSDYSKGHKYLIVDLSDSMLFSFLVEKDLELTNTLKMETIYSDGVFTSDILDKTSKNEPLIVRNSYKLKQTLNPNELETLTKAFIGRHGSNYELVLILVDDLKVTWRNTNRYVMLNPCLDSLMKFANYVKYNSDFYDFCYLIGNSHINDFTIDESIVKSYISTYPNVIIIDRGVPTSKKDVVDIYEESKLFELSEHMKMYFDKRKEVM